MGLAKVLVYGLQDLGMSITQEMKTSGHARSLQVFLRGLVESLLAALGTEIISLGFILADALRFLDVPAAYGILSGYIPRSSHSRKRLKF